MVSEITRTSYVFKSFLQHTNLVLSLRHNCFVINMTVQL